jgi:hypothetical protein
LENKKIFAYDGCGYDKYEGEGTFIEKSSGKILKRAEQFVDQDDHDTTLLTLMLERLGGKCKLNASHDDKL